MSIESAIAGAAASTAEGAISSVASSVVGTAVSAATASFNPLSYVKWGAYALGAAAALFLGFKVMAFIERADSNAAKVSTLADQVTTLTKIANDNAANWAQSDAQMKVVLEARNEIHADRVAREATTAKITEAINNDKPSIGCVPSPATAAALDRLRH